MVKKNSSFVFILVVILTIISFTFVVFALDKIDSTPRYILTNEDGKVVNSIMFLSKKVHPTGEFDNSTKVCELHSTGTFTAGPSERVEMEFLPENKIEVCRTDPIISNINLTFNSDNDLWFDLRWECDCIGEGRRYLQNYCNEYQCGESNVNIQFWEDRI